MCDGCPTLTGRGCRLCRGVRRRRLQELGRGTRLGADRLVPGSRLGTNRFSTPALPDTLNPLAPPSRRLEGIRKILCLVHDLAVAELHNAHCVCWFPLVVDGVFRDPEIAIAENSFDLKPRGLAGMMTPQGLQIAPSEDSFA